MAKKLLIVPYVPGSTDNSRPLVDFEQPILPLEQRQTLLYFRATCLPFQYVNQNNTRIGTGKVCSPIIPSCLTFNDMLEFPAECPPEGAPCKPCETLSAALCS